MPRIDDQTAEVKRPFKKKAYRPWNLLDEEESPAIEKPIINTTPEENVVINKIPISNQLETDKEPSKNQFVTATPDKVIKTESTSNPLSNPISNPFVKLEPQKWMGFPVAQSVEQGRARLFIFGIK